MPEYKVLDMPEINPCGIAEIPSTQCQYASKCGELGRSSGEFICISRQGYLAAGYLSQGSDVKTEKKDLREFVAEKIGTNFIDPESKWDPKRIKKGDVETIVEEALKRGQAMATKLNL